MGRQCRALEYSGLPTSRRLVGTRNAECSALNCNNTVSVLGEHDLQIEGGEKRSTLFLLSLRANFSEWDGMELEITNALFFFHTQFGDNVLTVSISTGCHRLSQVKST